jgi:hypothetical protein
MIYAEKYHEKSMIAQEQLAIFELGLRIIVNVGRHTLVQQLTNYFQTFRM